MVWPRMGLLDDAIRDHLELKRRRGADPGEVAREQQEALEPMSQGETAPAAGASGEGAKEGAGDRTQDASAEAAVVAQETEELDMESVLETEVEEGSGGTGLQDAATEGPQAPGWADDLDQDAHVVREIPGQERLSFE